MNVERDVCRAAQEAVGVDVGVEDFLFQLRAVDFEQTQMDFWREVHVGQAQVAVAVTRGGGDVRQVGTAGDTEFTEAEFARVVGVEFEREAVDQKALAGGGLGRGSDGGGGRRRNDARRGGVLGDRQSSEPCLSFGFSQEPKTSVNSGRA